MKNLEIMAGQFAAAVRSSGSTLRPGIARMIPPTTARSSFFSPLSITRKSPTSWPIWTRRYSTTVGIDDEHVASGLVGAERGIGHQQSRLRFVWNADTHEIAGQQAAIGIGQGGARGKRAGRRIDGRRDVIERAFVRKPAFVLQRHFDRRAEDIGLRLAGRGKARAHLQNVALAGGEVRVDRIHLHDGCEHGRRVGADELAERHLARTHCAVERRRHLGVVEIDRGLLRIRLRLLQVRPRAIARRLRLIEHRLRGELLAGEFGLALVFGLRLLQRCLGASLRRLRGGELQAVGFGLDGEQQRILFHEVAVGVADPLNEALHPRHEIDRIDSRRVAGRFEIAGDLPLCRGCHRDLRRRRRRVFVVVTATGEGERGGEQEGCGS
jgi:hypothetical protein